MKASLLDCKEWVSRALRVWLQLLPSPNNFRLQFPRRLVAEGSTRPP
jgi:hypothetical protein